MCNCPEIWKDINDYPNYRISSKGNVYSKFSKRNRKTAVLGKGYDYIYWIKKDQRWRVQITRNKKTHRRDYIESIEEAIKIRNELNNSLR